MSFEDELNAKVKAVRNNIKIEAINVFIDRLKTAMQNVAARGRTYGSISLRINLADYYEDDDDEVELCRLDELLRDMETRRLCKESRRLGKELVTVDENPMRFYKWLLEEVDKTGVFKGIYFGLNVEKFELDFFWITDEDEWGY